MSLVVQWLRIHLATQGMQVQTLVRKLRSHMMRDKQAHALQQLSQEPGLESPRTPTKGPAWGNESPMCHNWDPMQPHEYL